MDSFLADIGKLIFLFHATYVIITQVVVLLTRVLVPCNLLYLLIYRAYFRFFSPGNFLLKDDCPFRQKDYFTSNNDKNIMKVANDAFYFFCAEMSTIDYYDLFPIVNPVVV